MATNKSTVRALGNFRNIIDNVLSGLRSGSVISPTQLDKLEAYNRLLKKHLAAQRKQDGQFPKDVYIYNPKTKKLVRRRHGNLSSEV